MPKRRVLPKTRRGRRIAAAAIAAFILFGAVTARLFVWPDLPEPPARVDAIIELGGAGPLARDRVALDLARTHRAPVLVQSTVAEEARTGTCLVPPAPDVTILCFHPDPNTTRGEARYIARAAAEHHWRSIILVTTRDHAWRARLRVSRCFDGTIYVETSPRSALSWPLAIAYQWTATLKALTIERGC